ncbi:unnamed protein product [Ranitomeya imitator]|uniref:Uncharacterized protein n=1 Tax=Ranitomeya imitator TaxID=111125 RepID=A0ABN9MIR2_9NEOB|nr:unnamed protein product [Ranitomeya imitator]
MTNEFPFDMQLVKMKKPGHVCHCDFNVFFSLHTVIRAKAIVGKEVDSGNDVYGNPIKRIQYEIKQIKVYITSIWHLFPKSIIGMYP